VETNGKVSVALAYNGWGCPGDTAIEQRHTTPHPKVEAVTLKKWDKKDRCLVLPVGGVLPSRDRKLDRRHLPLTASFVQMFSSQWAQWSAQMVAQLGGETALHLSAR